MAETLVIGVGGVGTHVVRRLEERLAASPTQNPPALLCLDTDRSVEGATHGLYLTTTAAVFDAAYRAPDRFHAQWVDRSLLRGRGSMEQGTSGSRMLGRFLLLLPENLGVARARIAELLRTGEGEPAARRVYVVAGAAGGTGGGTAVDLGFLLQDLARESGVELDLRAVLFAPPPLGDPRLVVNSFAALTELNYFADPYTEYRAHLRVEGEPVITRDSPYGRVSLLTSINLEGATIPLHELQERAAVYLMTACVGDEGYWSEERRAREATVPSVDGDGNPQVFSTFGTEWVEYPEERLVGAVYRNLVRRSLVSWLQGDNVLRLQELQSGVPLHDGEALARMVTGIGQEEASAETYLRTVRPRLPWIHKAPPSQWQVMDQELEGLLAEAVYGPQEGTVRSRPRVKTPAHVPAKLPRGPMAARTSQVREQVVHDLRRITRDWLVRENTSLERVARILNEAATELRTANDPVGVWEDAFEASRLAKKRILLSAAAVRTDPFLIFWKRMSLRRLAQEYERVALLHVHHALRAESVPFLRELRGQVLEPVRAWAGRVGELGSLLARLSRAMADYESSLLERLRKDDEENRLALGMLRLPGSETPYISNTGWNLPFCRPEDEIAAIRDLRVGWAQRLVDRPDGLLALPGRSIVDGPDVLPDDRLPWLLPPSFSQSLEGGSARMREAVMHVDRELRAAMDDRLRGWLSATAFQRLAEQYREPLELEFQLRRLVTNAAELPALEPPHVRPFGFPAEYELVFFAESKAGELPGVMRVVVDAACQERPTRVVPSLSHHYLTVITDHPGFPLSRCPAFLHLEETYRELTKSRPAFPYSRLDVPWTSATLTTRSRIREGSDVLFLGLALGLLRGQPGTGVVIPGGVLPVEDDERRFPLPDQFDLAVRQLAGDVRLLGAVSQAVDRAVQSQGVEWCSLQVERALRGESPLPVRFPGAEPSQQMRTARLVALRATARYEDLRDEFSRTVTARDPEWLRVGNSHYCPACGSDLGPDPEAIPGACPACREPVLPHKIAGTAPADGFRRIPNPYVVGTPLETGANVFVGREDIIQQVHERLIRPAQRTILILVGERRSGKTSALRQLQYRLKGDLTPLFIDMQGLTATDLPGFLWWLAWRMKEALDERGIHVALPTWEQFSSGPADYQFETTILPEVRRALGGGRVLLMLDEFEVLAQRVMKGTFDSRAFDYLRHLMQHSEGIEFLFAGTHVLRQFAANYVTFLFNIGVFLDVDFLRPEDALRLVQEPVRAAGVTYTPDSLQAILELAGAHPYFTQLFGFHLVERLNRLRKREVTREDVEGEAGPVIAAGGAHLDHVWGQLSNPDRLLVSYFVEQCPRGQSIGEDELLQSAIREDPGLRPFVFRSAVEKLTAVGLLRLETVTGEDGRPVRTLRLTAEVYRQWLLTQHSYRRLREEGVGWE